MSYLTWLPGVLRRAGVDVYVMPGAETRSTWASGLTVEGVVWHHTATSIRWLDGHVAYLLRDGRPDLRGPLSQIGIERDGTWVIVAMGRANHNGFGTWGNDSIGLEFYNDGVGEPFTTRQYDSGIRGTAAICKFVGLNPFYRVKGHRETDPGRKVDPLLNVVNMGMVRTMVDATMRVTPKPIETKKGGRELIISRNSQQGKHKILFIDGVPFEGHGNQVTLTPTSEVYGVDDDVWNDIIRRFGVPIK